MSRDSKRKLAIVAGISECLVYAEAKYCAFEIHGEPKYYVCPRHEYCCNFGCCVSPGFQIYHLWYYWLLVIIMFLVCSGGGWWYRYWLQGRYRAAASAIPSRGTSSTRGHSSLRGPTCPAQQASITYNSARNTVLLHRMWKTGPHRGPGSSPAYTGPPVAAAASSTQFQNTSVVLNDVNCPYYQLYGPPPSYETVIAQTRGKLSTPLSPEHSTGVDASAVARSSTILQNSDTASRCYNHLPYSNNHPSQTGTIGGVDDTISRYEQSANGETLNRLETLEASSGFSRFTSSYANNDEETTPVHTAGRQDPCLPLHYHGGPLPSLDYHDDNAAIVPDTYRIYSGSDNLERLPSYHGDRTSLDRKTRRQNGLSATSMARDQQRHSPRGPLPGESHSSVPDLKIETGEINSNRRGKTPQDDHWERYSRRQGGSLKFSRSRGETSTTTSVSRASNPLDEASTSWDKGTRDTGMMNDDGVTTSVDVDDYEAIGSFTRSTRKGLLNVEDAPGKNVTRVTVKQETTNPSENVILEPLNSIININENDDGASTPCWRTRRHNENDEKRRRRVPSPGTRGISNDDEKVVENTINNHESKRNKLDRSRSLD